MEKVNRDAKITGDMSQDISPVPKGFISKTLHFFRRHKIIAGILIFIVLIIILRIITMPFVAISFPETSHAHSTGSIVFDRWQMNRVNRIEFKCRRTGEISVIEDAVFISEFVSHTMVANTIVGELCLFNIYIYLYRDNTLIRRMERCWLHFCILVYRPSRRHWFFFNFFMPSSNGGIVKLPRELENYISQFTITFPHEFDDYISQQLLNESISAYY